MKYLTTVLLVLLSSSSLVAQVDNDNEAPLYEELFSDKAAPDRFLIYDAGRFDAREGDVSRRAMRATAMRFGARFVHEEQLDLAGDRGYVPYGRMSDPGNRTRGIGTWSRAVEPPPGNALVSLPDNSLSLVYGGRGWLLDPRYLDYLVAELSARAGEREFWGVPQFDEIWTYYAIKPVPRDKWYAQVEEADREIREQYGFGNYGFPESHEDGGPFERIAHRRWASDRLTETFARIHESVKAINPEMKLIGSTHGSSGTSADMESWGPYFDILGGQCAGGASDNLIDFVRPGCVTRLYVDLTRRPIWMMVHMSKGHAKRRDPEYIREAYSQVFRNGGENVWLMSSEFFEAELSDAMFCEPFKWRAMSQLAESISTMRLPNLPEADCAILFSSNSTYATLWGGLSDDNDRIISAYTVAGPCLRSWPQFVSDRQIERGERDLNDYKVLYVPYNAYATPALLDKLKEYARGGGTVICTDTDAFTWNINGETFGEIWTEFVGVRKTGDRADPEEMRFVAGNQIFAEPSSTITPLVAGSQIESVSPDLENLAEFEDGTPAITRHPYGAGQVLFFAADPFRSLGVDMEKKSIIAKDSAIVRFLDAVHRSEGVTMGHDVWRFKLPAYREDVFAKEEGVCLTNNYVYDANEPLLESNNRDTQGSYTYDLAPDGIPDDGGADGQVPFAKGHLTNRLQAFETRNRREYRDRSREALDKVTADWIVRWNDTRPIEIRFDLKQPYQLNRLRLFHSGATPAFTVSGSVDGNSWTEYGTTSRRTSLEADIGDVTLFIEGVYRYVKLTIGPRNRDESFDLCELEVWGE